MTINQTAMPSVTVLTRSSRVLRRDYSTQLSVRLANDKKTQQECYKLRYTSYFAEGYIEPSRSKAFSDEYDDDENAQTLVIYKGSQAIASTRICFLNRDSAGTSSGGVPAQHMFPEEVETMFQSDAAAPGQSIVEINRLVRHPEFAEDKTLIFTLFRLAGYMILKKDARVVVSCVRRNHVPFYTRLRFAEVAGPRLYHGVKFSTHLLSCTRERYDLVRKMVPLLDVTGAGREHYDRLANGESVDVLP